MHVSLIHNFIHYMWFCIDTFSLNNMLSYYTYTCTAWLWWWHTCTIIFSPRWHKALEFMLPDAKGRGGYNISGLSFYWGTNTVLSPEKTKACSAEPVVVRARQNLWCRYSEFWWAGNLLNTLQNNSMYMHWEIRINYSEMLLNLYFTGRNVVFTDRNGVSLSGEVCLNHTDVPQVWLMVCFIVVWLMVCFIVYHGEFAVVLRHNLFMLICCCSVLFKKIL